MEPIQKKHLDGTSSYEPDANITQYRKNIQDIRRHNFAEKIKAQLKTSKEHVKSTHDLDKLASSIKKESVLDHIQTTDRSFPYETFSLSKSSEAHSTDSSLPNSSHKQLLTSSIEMHKQVSRSLSELKGLKNSLDQLYAATVSKSRATLLEQILKEKLGNMNLNDITDTHQGCLLCGCNCGSHLQQSAVKKTQVFDVASDEKAEVYSINLSNMNLLKPCSECHVVYMASDKSTKTVCEACRCNREEGDKTKASQGMCLLLRVKTQPKSQKNSADTPVRQKSEVGYKLRLRSVTPPKRRLPSINNPFVTSKEMTDFQESVEMEIKIGSAKVPINLNYRTHYYKLILPVNTRLSLTESLSSSQRFTDNPITPSFKMKSNNELSYILSQVREDINLHTRKLSEETPFLTQPSRMKDFISQLLRLKSSGKQTSDLFSKILNQQIRKCSTSDSYQASEICSEFYKKYLKICIQLIGDIAEILPEHTVALRNLIEGMVLLTEFSLSFISFRHKESTIVIDSSLRSESIK